jgi:hypothetical protein
MASGHRKRKAAALRIEVLNPAGLTNVSEADRGNTTNQNNLINIATYSRDGVTPTFITGSTTQLSDVISNFDGAFTKAGLNGEVTNTGVFLSSSMSSSTGITSVAKHYYFPKISTVSDLSSSNAPNSPVIVYSADGPQSSYVPFYFGGTVATASIKFGTQITGAGLPTHLVVYVGGQLETGDQIRVVKTSDSTPINCRVLTGSDISSSVVLNLASTASASELFSSSFRKAFLIPTGNISDVTKGMTLEFCTLSKTSTTPSPGVFVAISSGTYGTNP